MQLNEDLVEMIVANYLVSKSYIKEADYNSHAEEYLRSLVEQGLEFEELAEELPQYDVALSNAVDLHADEFNEDSDW